MLARRAKPYRIDPPRGWLAGSWRGLYSAHSTASKLLPKIAQLLDSRRLTKRYGGCQPDGAISHASKRTEGHSLLIGGALNLQRLSLQTPVAACPWKQGGTIPRHPAFKR